MNTVEIKTRIESNIDKAGELKSNSANLIADFILGNSKNRSISQIMTDVKKLLNGYSDQDIQDILLQAIAIVGKNCGKGSQHKDTSTGSDSASFLKNKGKGTSPFGNW